MPSPWHDLASQLKEIVRWRVVCDYWEYQKNPCPERLINKGHECLT